MKVAILGTGKMGGAIARRLHQQGFDLRLWNRTRQRAEQLGIGQVFDTPAEAASGADVLISMLTDPPAVRQAYLGPNGALEAPGARIYVDSSTVDPRTHEELARAAAQRGSTFIEAPSRVACRRSRRESCSSWLVASPRPSSESDRCCRRWATFVT